MYEKKRTNALCNVYYVLTMAPCNRLTAMLHKTYSYLTLLWTYRNNIRSSLAYYKAYVERWTWIIFFCPDMVCIFVEAINKNKKRYSFYLKLKLTLLFRLRRLQNIYLFLVFGFL